MSLGEMVKERAPLRVTMSSVEMGVGDLLCPKTNGDNNKLDIRMMTGIVNRL